MVDPGSEIRNPKNHYSDLIHLLRGRDYLHVNMLLFHAVYALPGVFPSDLSCTTYLVQI